jgi:GT2 family glycosyltransferase
LARLVKISCHFLTVTVLFKTAPSQSSSLQSFARCIASGHGLTCIVWDNSPQAAEPEELAWLRTHLPGCVYRHSPENLSLSHIYNAVIGEFLRTRNDSTVDALLITDQDSRFEPELVAEANAAMTANPDVSLFLPHVIANDAIVSPANVYACIGLPWRRRRVGRIAARGHTAINSGMIVRSEYLVRRFPGYDERLRFYGTDNDFCRKYAKTERWMYALNSVVTHSLARDANEATEVKLSRHRENVRALLVVNGDDWKRRTGALLYCVAYCSKMAIAERDVRFLTWG